MGCFDHVKFSTTCPNCNRKVSGFQSKSAECLSDTLEFWQVTNFYATCENCRTWIEFTSKKDVRSSIEDYEMIYHSLGRKRPVTDRGDDVTGRQPSDLLVYGDSEDVCIEWDAGEYEHISNYPSWLMRIIDNFQVIRCIRLLCPDFQVYTRNETRPPSLTIKGISVTA